MEKPKLPERIKLNQERTRLNKGIYLSQKEYHEMHFIEIEDEEEYRKLFRKALDVLHHVTRHFYVFNSFENDTVIFRKKAFLKALACQIEYFYETGETTTQGLNSEPQSQQIGRTSITKTSRFNPRGNNEQNTIICQDVYMYLSVTGLLYRGVG